MPKPIKRKELLRRLRALGWDGPKAGGKHGVMRNALGHKLSIPNPHGGDLDWTVVKLIIRQAGISPDEWEELGRQ